MREDGQGFEDQIVGVSAFDPRFGFAGPKDLMLFPGAGVSAPVGQRSVEWLRSLTPAFVERVGRRL